TEDLKFVSDPVWFGRHIAELNATNQALVSSYVWGLDLSETLHGAGGVGGLLWVRLASGPFSGAHFVTYDGNGNVWQLVSSSTGTATARYEYGPFGEPLRTTGPMVKENPFRFSAKYQDGETDLLYYGYRYYNPSTGRRLSRDPIEERGGRNLYGFCRNDAVARLDSPGQNDLAFCGPMMTGDVEWHTPSELEVEISLLIAALMTPVPGDEGLAAAVLTKRLAKLLNKGGKCLKCRCRVGTGRVFNTTTAIYSLLVAARVFRCRTEN
ncbi:MAG: RHS repeat-associated core domain-containing protein, partial [Limisphaera sp.]|nr:RHS repeat-associated core domain-containing protein [Limisphaera sp.]